MKKNDFIEPALSVKNLDNFFIRKSIFEAIKKNLSKFSGNLLDVGCGKMPYKEYILRNSSVGSYLGLDIETALVYDENLKPDAFWNGATMPFGKETFETVIATEMLEHCFEPNIVLKEVNRVLTEDGLFFFTVPFLWPLHESPHDEYRYTPYSLRRLLEEAGFTDIEIYNGGGWHASMAQMLGLWVMRSPLRKWQRKIFSIIIKSIMKVLISKDKKEDFSVRDQLMLTNIYGTARK